jgi:hypothetical protein
VWWCRKHKETELIEGRGRLQAPFKVNPPRRPHNSIEAHGNFFLNLNCVCVLKVPGNFSLIFTCLRHERTKIFESDDFCLVNFQWFCHGEEQGEGEIMKILKGVFFSILVKQVKFCLTFLRFDSAILRNSEKVLVSVRRLKFLTVLCKNILKI